MTRAVVAAFGAAPEQRDRDADRLRGSSLRRRRGTAPAARSDPSGGEWESYLAASGNPTARRDR